jgi:hypothetical protein
MLAKPRVEEQVHGLVVAHLDRQEQRRLALGHRFQPVPVRGEPLRQRWEFAGELQQQLQLLLAGHRVEVVHDVLQPWVQRAGAGHGLSPLVMGTPTLFPHSVQEPS